MSVSIKFKVALLLFVALCMTPAARAQVFCDSLISRGVREMQKENFGTSIKLLLEAKTTAEHGGFYKQQFLANNIIGANYFAMLDYAQALKYYLAGYKIASYHLEDSFKMAALNNIAILYGKEKKYDKALECFTKAYEYARSQKDLQKSALYIMNIGILAYEKHDYPKATKCMAEALKSIRGESNLLLVRLTMARIAVRQGNIVAGRKIASDVLEEYKNSDFRELLINFEMVVAEADIAQKEYRDAIAILQSGLHRTTNAETRRELFQFLSTANEKQGNYPGALAFRDSVFAAQERITAARNEIAYQHDNLRFEVEEYKSRLRLKDQELRSNRTIVIMILVLILIGAGTITVIVRAKSQKRKLRAEKKEQLVLLALEQEKNSILLLEKRMEEEEARAQRQEEELKQSVREKNKELSMKAFSLSKRNELIEEIITTFSKMPKFKENQLFLTYLKRLQKEVSSTDEWEDFTRHFNELNYGFLRKLKECHPDLSNNDVRFIIYIYMSLNTKEISNLLGITSESTRKRKERIAAKMGLKGSRGLYDYLSQI